MKRVMLYAVSVILAVIVICNGWHDARIFLPVLPFVPSFISVLWSDFKKALDVCTKEDL